MLTKLLVIFGLKKSISIASITRPMDKVRRDLAEYATQQKELSARLAERAHQMVTDAADADLEALSAENLSKKYADLVS